MNKIVIGIDVGISTTKIVGLREGKVISPMRITATDPVTSLYGAFGKYLYDNKILLENVRQVMLTGVGSAYIDNPIYGLPTNKSDEFLCDGLGAQYESGLRRFIVVSMGTGTAYLDATKNNVRHIIGSGVGGGTLVGLGMALTGTSDAVKLSDMATSGDILKCDLTIGDITKNGVTGLPMNVTASNFGKAADDLSREDKMAGVFNLVYQAVGTVAVMASRQCNLKDIVFTGQLTDLKECQQYLLPFEDLYGVNMIIPEDAVFATALGSCLAEGQADK